MKKFLPIFCTLTLLASQSQAANGVFIGVDALRSDARHEAKNSSALSGPQNNSKSNSPDAGYGANFGIRFDPLFLYVAAELFYEDLNSSANGFPQNVTGVAGPTFEMNERYGAKGNVGVTIFPWFTPFLTYGVANVKYQTDVSKSKTAPIYGVGILFDIPLTNFSVKASYDVQKLDKLTYQNGVSDTKLGVARLGLTYTFGI